jgi:membrane protein involved in colicin uptake
VVTVDAVNKPIEINEKSLKSGINSRGPNVFDDSKDETAASGSAAATAVADLFARGKITGGISNGSGVNGDSSTSRDELLMTSASDNVIDRRASVSKQT